MWIECRDNTFINLNNVHTMDLEYLNHIAIPFDDHKTYVEPDTDVWVSIDSVDVVAVTSETSGRLLIRKLIELNGEVAYNTIYTQQDIADLLEKYNYT